MPQKHTAFFMATVLAFGVGPLAVAQSQELTDAEIKYRCFQEMQRNVTREIVGGQRSVLNVLAQAAFNKVFEQAQADYIVKCESALKTQKVAIARNANNQSQIDWGLFVQQYPDATSHLTEIINMVNVDTNLPPYIAYLKLRAFFNENGMEW